MTRPRRRSPCVWIACAALLIAAAVIPSGCGSAPTAEQERGAVTEETAQAPEEAPTQEAAADESVPAESALPEQSPEPSAPPAGRAAPRQPAPEPPAPAQAVPTPDAPTPVQPVAAAAPAVDWVGSAQKWVPIFSLESEGVHLGAAQIAGPSSQLAKVKGVAELRLRFKDVGRVYAYVPVSTISLTKLDRVQGVSVWAVGDLELAEL